MKSNAHKSARLSPSRPAGCLLILLAAGTLVLGGLDIRTLEAAPPAINSIQLNASGLIEIHFTELLQSAPQHTGTWTDVPGATISPFVEFPFGPAKFFRTRDDTGANSPTTVGYYNLTLRTCANLIANQLDNGAGNKIVDVLPAAVLPNSTTVKKWNSAIANFDVLTVVPGQNRITARYLGPACP